MIGCRAFNYITKWKTQKYVEYYEPGHQKRVSKLPLPTHKAVMSLSLLPYQYNTKADIFKADRINIYILIKST